MCLSQIEQKFSIYHRRDEHLTKARCKPASPKWAPQLEAEECVLPLGHGSNKTEKETHNTDNNDYGSDHLKQTSKIPFTTNLGWRKQSLFQLR